MSNTDGLHKMHAIVDFRLNREKIQLEPNIRKCLFLYNSYRKSSVNMYSKHDRAYRFQSSRSFCLWKNTKSFFAETSLFLCVKKHRYMNKL